MFRRLLPFVFLLSACSSDRADLPLQPVHGIATFVGGEKLTGGTVGFTPLDSVEGSASGEIQPDGTFTVHTFVNGQKKPGMLAGSYQVSVRPPGSGESFVEPIELPTPVKIVVGDNQIPIELPAPTRR